MSSILIRGARVLDPQRGFDGLADVAIRDGKIEQVGGTLSGTYDETIEAQGLWLLPSAVDLAVRFREPGATHKASFASETRAAQAAGIGAVLLQPDTTPAIDSPALVDRIRGIAAKHPGLDVHLLGALTQGLAGEALASMGALQRAGCSGFSQARAPLRDHLVARRALDYAQGLNATVHVFAQDAALAQQGVAHEGAVATRLGLASIPVAAEVAALRLWLSLIEDTGARVHFGRLSTAQGAGLVASAQRRGLPVTADVAAHQLFLTDADLEGFNAMAHVIPPLRSAQDREALRQAVKNGVIGSICSDHEPHEADAKTNPYPLTEPGISALETLLPLTLELVHEGLLTPLQLAERLSLGPAAVLGLTPPAIAVGAAANLVLVDADQEWTLRSAELVSRGRNTPFEGRRFRGRAVSTLHAGQVVFRR